MDNCNISSSLRPGLRTFKRKNGLFEIPLTNKANDTDPKFGRKKGLITLNISSTISSAIDHNNVFGKKQRFDR